MPIDDPDPSPRLTLWQRVAVRRMLRAARRRPGESLSPEDWLSFFRFMAQSRNQAIRRLMRSLPSSPRCGYCGAPFAGAGGRVVRRLGYRPSRKNPNLCSTCVELAPPGGTTMDVGVLFIDIRGFTALSEGLSPEQVGTLLKRFYAVAEEVLFPEALIDKLIGDEVMALYVPAYVVPNQPSAGAQEPLAVIAPIMLNHARRLLERVGYGSADGPFVEVGIGLDFGEAFVGNIGESAVLDFTAVGDVVNTASRLQGSAQPGEIMVSDRLACGFGHPMGEPLELAVRGKALPVTARRISVDGPHGAG